MQKLLHFVVFNFFEFDAVDDDFIFVELAVLLAHTYYD